MVRDINGVYRESETVEYIMSKGFCSWLKDLSGSYIKGLKCKDGIYELAAKKKPSLEDEEYEPTEMAYWELCDSIMGVVSEWRYDRNQLPVVKKKGRKKKEIRNGKGEVILRTRRNEVFPDIEIDEVVFVRASLEELAAMVY